MKIELLNKELEKEKVARKEAERITAAKSLELDNSIQQLQETDKQRTISESIATELRQVIKTINTPVFGLDSKGLVNKWNDAAEKITGYTKDNVLGKDLVKTYITEDHQKAVKKTVNNALLGKETGSYQLPLFTKQGHRKIVLLNTSTRRDVNANITGVLGVLQDITELNHQNKEKEKGADELAAIKVELEQQIVCLDEAAIVSEADAEGNIIFVNDKFCEISGYPREELIGQNHRILKSGKQPDGLFIGMWAAISSGRVWKGEIMNKKKDGNEFYWVDTTIMPFKDLNGKIIKYVGIRFDITEQVEQQENLLKQSKELRQFIDTANAPIFGLDSKGFINEWNQTSEKVIGFKKDEVFGKNLVQTYISKDHRESVKKVLDDALHGKETANYEFPLFSKDGTLLMILLNSSTRRDVNGEITGVLAVGHDITELAKNRTITESIAKELREFIETVSAPIFGIDNNGLVNEWNQTSEKIIGFKKEEVVGKDLVQTYISEEYQESIKKVLDDALLGKETASYEFPLLTKNGDTLMVLLNSSTRRDANGEITGVLGVGQEITELVGYRNELELKVNERTLKLNKALKKEKELSELKTKFVSTASHEFRTPLSAINFAAGSIKKYWAKMEPVMIDKKLHKIEDQVKHMTKLLDDILVVGQAESGKIRYSPLPINLGFFIKEIIEEVYSSYKKSHEITLIDDQKLAKSIILIDEKLGRNIFINLISNAIKFSPEAKKITVEFSSEKEYINISITDYGIGIHKSEFKNIFQPFTRGENVDLIQGTGLGLSIAKEAIDVIGGKIIINSTVGYGTSFIVKIPKT